MTSTSARPILLVLGAGPGLGMSVAHRFGNVTAATLNPDDLAETVWRLYTEQTGAEAVVNALGE